MSIQKILLYLLNFFTLFLFIRIIIEMVRSFARSWHPNNFLAAVLEIIFRVTDPVIKLFRKLIPPLKIGNVQLDLSVMIIMFIIIILSQIIVNV